MEIVIKLSDHSTWQDHGGCDQYVKVVGKDERMMADRIGCQDSNPKEKKLNRKLWPIG